MEVKKRHRNLLRTGVEDICILIFLLVFSNSAFSQYMVNGFVSTKKGKAIANCEVCLYRESLEPLKRLTDSSGYFLLQDIPKGKFDLVLKLGSDTLFKKRLHLDRDTSLGIISIELPIKLEEVVVLGQSRIVELQVDRLVYYVSEDPYNKGASLFESLHRAPRLNVKDKVNIIGKSDGAAIMINGRIQNMSPENLVLKLKSMRTEQIEKVEIIPTPPSKYPAAGNTGMINIVLKRNENLGLQVNLNSSLGVQYKNIVGSEGINLNYQVEKFSASLNVLNLNGNNSNVVMEEYDGVSNRTTMNRTTKFRPNTISLNGTLQYDISKTLLVGAFFDANRGNNRSAINNSSYYFNKIENLPDSLINSDNTYRYKTKGNNISLFTDLKLDSLGSKVSLTYNNTSNNNTSNLTSNAKIQSTDKKSNAFFSNEGENTYRINGVILDSQFPLKSIKIEAGASYNVLDNESETKFFDSENVLNEDISNNFDYRESIFGSYLSLEKQFGKWSSKVGLRYENTDLKGVELISTKRNDKNYSNLFPTLFLNYGPNDNHSFSLSYSSRISRANFMDLNPFRYYTDIHNYTLGNPALEPSLIHSIEGSYSYKDVLYFAPSFTKTKNGIAYLALIDEENNFRTEPINNFDRKKIGCYMSYKLRLLDRNELKTGGELFYSNLTSERFVETVKGWGGSLTVRNSYSFDKNKSSLLQMVYSHYFPSPSGVDEFERTSSDFSINFRQQLFSKSLSIDVWVFDVFRQNIGLTYKYYTDMTYNKRNDLRVQGFSIGLSYSFGKKNVFGIFRDTKNTEQRRLSK